MSNKRLEFDLLVAKLRERFGQWPPVPCTVRADQVEAAVAEWIAADEVARFKVVRDPPGGISFLLPADYERGRA